jgi:TRAP-type C4-dicarboxylate transport system substrate-binding protein
MRFPALAARVALALTASASGAAAEPVAIKYATTAPPGSHIAKFFEAHVEELNKANPDAVKFRIYHSTLGNMQTIYDNTKNEVADIAWIAPTMIPGKFKKTEFTRLPGVCDIAEYCSVAIWHAYQKGLYGDEFNEVPAIAVHAYPPSYIHTQKAVVQIDDLKGMKVGGLGKEAADIIQNLKGTPLSIQLFSFYTSLQNHMIEGVLTSYTAFDPFKLHEVTSYHYEISSGGSNAYMGIAKQTWDKLPAAAKKVIEDLEGEKFSRELGKFWDGVAADTRGRVAKLPGHQIVTIAPEVQARIDRVMAPMVADWLKSVPGGAEVFNFVKADYQAQLKAKPTN